MKVRTKSFKINQVRKSRTLLKTWWRLKGQLILYFFLTSSLHLMPSLMRWERIQQPRDGLQKSRRNNFCRKFELCSRFTKQFVTSRIYYDNVDKKAVMVNSCWRRTAFEGPTIVIWHVPIECLFFHKNQASLFLTSLEIGKIK